MRTRPRRKTLALLAATALVALSAGPLSAALSQTTGDDAKPKNPLAGDGMWIWYLSRSSHGNLGKLASRAHRFGIETVLIKSGDGTKYWSQFSSGVVSALR